MIRAKEFVYFRDNLLFFYLLLIQIFRETPYYRENPSGFLLFFLNLVWIFQKNFLRDYDPI